MSDFKNSCDEKMMIKMKMMIVIKTLMILKIEILIRKFPSWYQNLAKLSAKFAKL